jgi:hypothetical protein
MADHAFDEGGALRADIATFGLIGSGEVADGKSMGWALIFSGSAMHFLPPSKAEGPTRMK